MTTTSGDSSQNGSNNSPSSAHEKFQKEAELRIRRLEELERKGQQIDEIFAETSVTINEALKRKNLEGETQRELSILYKLIENVRSLNSVYLAKQLQTAVNILTSEASPATENHQRSADEADANSSATAGTENTVTKLVAENQALQNRLREQEDLIKKLERSARYPISDSKFINNIRNFFIAAPDRPRNFFLARRIRREIEYQTSTRGSRSAWLILGLACSLGIIAGLPTLILTKTSPPTITLSPDLDNNLVTVSGTKEFRLKIDNDGPALFQNPDQSDSNVYTLSLSDNNAYELSLLDENQYRSVLAEQMDEGADQISENLEIYFTNTLLSSLNTAIREGFRGEMISVLTVEENGSALTAEINDYIDTALDDVLDDVVAAAQEEEGSVSVAALEDAIARRTTPSDLAFLNDIWVGSTDIQNNVDEETIAEYVDAIAAENPALFASEDGTPAYLEDLSDELVSITRSIGDRAIESLYASPDAEANNQAAAEADSESSATTTTPENADERSNLNDTIQDLGINLRLLVVVVAGGAFGGFAFIVLQVQNPRFYVDQDRFSLFITGLLKPISGVALAVFLYALLKSQISPIAFGADFNNENKERTTLAYFAISFVAGFSQLFVQDLIAKTQGSVSISSSERKEGAIADPPQPPV